MRRLFLILALLILLPINYFFKNYVNDYVTQVVILIGINIIMTISLNLISGFTGQFSLGHAGFMAIGAYVSSALSVFLPPLVCRHFPGFTCGLLTGNFWIQQIIFVTFILAGGTVAAFCGFIVGIPTLRLKGDYLAIVTLGFGEIIRVIILNMEAVGGARGFTSIPDRANFFWVFFWVLIIAVLVWKMVYSTRGKSFMAIRDDEIAAAAMGISPTRVKVTSFVLGAFFAGIGGGLFAHFIAYLNPGSFTFLKSVEFVAMVVLGGLGSITGSILSAALLTLVSEALRIASEYRMVIYSAMLVVIMIFRPEGIMGMREWRIFKKR